MSRNGSGLYTLPAGNPVVTGTVISSTVQNATMTDIATALTQSIASTGVTNPTANLPMNTYRHTGVGNANAQACYASVTDVQNGSLVSLSAVSGTDTITANAPLTVAGYVAGQGFRFVAAASNTGAVTINISALGAKAITKTGATALNAGDIAIGGVYEIVYDGTQFQLIGARQGASVGALVVNARSSNTIFGTGDLGSMNQFTSTFTQTFSAAATVGAGWYIDVQNIGTGVITFDANSSEVFNTPSGGLTTINLYPGEGYRIVCNGSSFDLVGRSNVVMLQAPQAASSAVVDVEQGFTDPEFSEVYVNFSGVTVNGFTLSLRVKKSGSYVTGATYSSGLSYMNGAAALSSTGQTLGFVNGQNSTSAQEVSGVVRVLRPTNTIGNQAIFTDAASPEVSNPQGNRNVGGIYETTAGAIEGIRFLENGGGGVIVSGRFTSYGVRG